MRISRLYLYVVVIFWTMGTSGNSTAQVLSDAEQNCNEWWSFNTSDDSSNLEYFNNVFGQYGAYPMLDPYPEDLPYPSWDNLPDTKQCIWLKDNVPVGWSYDWPEIIDTSSGTQRYSVKAFPEIIYGEKGEFGNSPNKMSNSESGFPIKATDVLNNTKLIDVEFSYSEYLATEVGRNVAIEAFFHETGGDCSEIRGDNRKLEIMIWTERPSNEFSITQNKYADGVSIGGYSWNVYYRETPQDFIVFEASPTFSKSDIVSSTIGRNSTAEGNYNWNEFVKYVYDNQSGLQITFDPEYCMAGLEFGTEIWFGKGEFRINNYSVNVSEGDSDNDGVLTKEDSCPATSESMQVTVGSCPTGIANIVQSNGCSIADELSACDAYAANSTGKSKGQFGKCIAGVTNSLKKRNLLTGKEKGKIQSCAGKTR